MIGPGRVLRADPARNLLIFVGGGTEARDVSEMVRVFDVDWMAGMSFGLFPVEIADAKTLVGELEAVFAQDGDSPIAGMLRFLPIERLPRGPGRLSLELDWNPSRRRWHAEFVGAGGARSASEHSPLFAWGVVKPALRKQPARPPRSHR